MLETKVYLVSKEERGMKEFKEWKDFLVPLDVLVLMEKKEGKAILADQVLVQKMVNLVNLLLMG